ncbi:hypothetical protein NDU88_002838 [Pleurodeles waltl]|uniref:Uncharacterized protein n=1 Tax=Pleurodeles waltl TaxID=8319 RepID=A0AAV7M2U1_PLEWA|nr:hypothetical protein NDU88_002838 [Pleurodeles waltl]
MVEGILHQLQHVPNKNQEEGMLRRTEKAQAYVEDGQDAKKMAKKHEHPEGGGDMCSSRGDVDQAYKDAEQRYKEGLEEKQGTNKIGKLQFRDPAACHVPGRTWLAQARRSKLPTDAASMDDTHETYDVIRSGGKFT